MFGMFKGKETERCVSNGVSGIAVCDDFREVTEHRSHKTLYTTVRIWDFIQSEWESHYEGFEQKVDVIKHVKGSVWLLY